jgi:hypothetical protein
MYSIDSLPNGGERLTGSGPQTWQGRLRAAHRLPTAGPIKKGVAMATKDIVSIGLGKYPGFNVSNPVGPDCANQPGDVLLIKAMLAFIKRYLGRNRVGSNLPWGLPIDPKSAFFNFDVGDAISNYQWQNKSRRIPRADGVIHPASYKGRVISAKDPRRMTITALHEDCVDALLVAGLDYADYTVALAKFCPALNGFIKDMTNH